MKRIRLKDVFILILVVTLSGVLGLTAGATATAEEIQPLSIEEMELQERLSAQEPAQNAYTEFLLQLSQDQNGDFLYPSTFSGAYMDKETFKLCIALTDTSAAVVDEYDKMFSDPSVVVYKKATYSYNELLEMQRDIEEEYDCITSIGIDEEENVVDVRVSDISLVDGASPSPASLDAEVLPIQISYDSGIQSCADLLRGGDGVTGYTIGMCGTYNGSDALLLCGHGLSKNDSITYNGNDIATVVKVQYNDGQKYDYAIATIDSGADVTMSNRVINAVNYTTITSALSSLPAKNTIVCRYGKNSGFATYTVENNNRTVIVDETVTIKGLVECLRESGSKTVKGDSGGPYYAGHVFYGVTHGYGDTYEYYSPISGVTSLFSVKTS